MLQELREIVWSCNLELPRNGLVRLTSGNVSGRDAKTNLVVIKPSGVSYEEMHPEDMVIVDVEGNVVEGNLKPSTDTATHLYVYRNRPDVVGICHTHSIYATTFAALGEPIRCCLTAAAMIGGDIPLGAYVPIGGEAIGSEIVEKIGTSRAIIMQNHGVFTIGRTPQEAVRMAVEVEEIAMTTHLAMLRGEPRWLTPDQVAKVADLYATGYGQQRRRDPSKPSLHASVPVLK